MHWFIFAMKHPQLLKHHGEAHPWVLGQIGIQMLQGK